MAHIVNTPHLPASRGTDKLTLTQHEPRLCIPPQLAPSEASDVSSGSAESHDSDGPLSYTRFSNLVEQSFDGVALSDLIIVKRSSWDALCGERDEEDELHEEARKTIEKTYEDIMESYKITLMERYKEDLAKMAGRIAELEAGTVGPASFSHTESGRGGGVILVGVEDKLAIAEERIRDLETKVDCLKLILAGRITDRERVASNTGCYHGDIEERTSAASWARHGAPSPSPAPPTVITPTGPRAILTRKKPTGNNQPPTPVSTPTTTPITKNSPQPRQQPRAVPGIITRPQQLYTTPHITTDRLVGESRSRRRAIYITNLGPNFSLPGLLRCVTQGPLERIIQYPYRGTCLLLFTHATHAQALFAAGNSRTSKNPFAGKFQANVNWADQAVVRMDYYVASRIVECGATRIVKFTGLEAGMMGKGGVRGEVDKNEILTWWGGKNNYLIDVTVKDNDGRREAVVECESVRDAWWRVQQVTMKVKEGILKVGWEWMPDYCAVGSLMRK